MREGALGRVAASQVDQARAVDSELDKRGEKVTGMRKQVARSVAREGSTGDSGSSAKHDFRDSFVRL